MCADQGRKPPTEAEEERGRERTDVSVTYRWSLATRLVCGAAAIPLACFNAEPQTRPDLLNWNLHFDKVLGDSYTQ